MRRQATNNNGVEEEATIGMSTSTVSTSAMSTSTSLPTLLTSAVEEGLSNPLILSKILSYSTEKRTARLVCKMWNEVILSLPRPGLSFVVNPPKTVACCDDEVFKLFVKGNKSALPKLVRWVTVRDKCTAAERQEGSHFKNEETVGLNSLDFFASIKPLTECVKWLSVTVKGVDVPKFYKIVVGNFPNLKSVSVVVRGRRQPLGGIMQLTDVLNMKPKLEGIRVQCGLSIPGDILHEMVQGLVDVAPNLKKIELFINSFPDLSKNKQLESFVYCGIKGRDDNRRLRLSTRTLHLDRLSVLLEQVSGSLKHLNLRLHKNWGDCDERYGVDFVMPKFPGLVSFSSNFIHIFKCGDSLENIVGGNLKSLTFSKGFGKFGDVQWLMENITTFPRYLKSPIQGLESLSIGGLKDVRVLKGIKKPFPNLVRLEICLEEHWLPTNAIEDGAMEYDEQWQLDVALETCGTLELRHFKINSCFIPPSSDIVKCLGNHLDLFQSEKFRRLEIGSIWKNGPPTQSYWVAPTWDNRTRQLFEKVLMSMKGMESVVLTDVDCSKRTADNIQMIIEKYKLPVTFRCLNYSLMGSTML